MSALLIPLASNSALSVTEKQVHTISPTNEKQGRGSVRRPLALAVKISLCGQWLVLYQIDGCPPQVIFCTHPGLNLPRQYSDSQNC